MTREEEEIAVAFNDYRDALKLSTFGDFEYIDIQEAFEAGAKWADQHPNNVWHDASEEPKGTYIVLCDGLDNRQWVVDYLHIDMSYANWQDYADAISVCRWAYTSDLLPKGGER